MIVAVIPTRYHPPELDALLTVLEADGIRTFVMESANYDHRIYRMWNAGLSLAEGADHIAILNDDIRILPGTLELLAKAIDADPAPAHWVAPEWPPLAVTYPDINAPWSLPAELQVQRTTGTWGVGGMTGYCFMLRGDLPIRFDESYHWWYGDDAFEQAVRDAGYGVGRVMGLPIQHSPDGSASRRWDELGPLIEQDRARWHDSWDQRSARAYVASGRTE